MAFTDQYALATNATFIQKVQVAMMTAAVNVKAEAVAPNDPTIYDKRQRLAETVLKSAGNDTLQNFVWAVATNPAITSGSTDSDIQFTVNSMWSALSGVRATD